MPQIYVIYRPEDTRKRSSEIINVLQKSYGTANVKSPDFSGYVDVYEIERQVQKTDYLLVIIGNYWVDLVDETGVNLLHSVYDPVHMAIATAINARKRIIPILVDGASMPHRARLPRELRPMTTQESVKIGKNDTVSKSLNKGLKDMIKEGNRVKIPDFVPRRKASKSASTSPPSPPVLRGARRSVPQRDWHYWVTRLALPIVALVIAIMLMVLMIVPLRVTSTRVVVPSAAVTAVPVQATAVPTATATNTEDAPAPTETVIQQNYPRITVENASQLTRVKDDTVGLSQTTDVLFTQDRTLFIFMSPEFQEVQVRDIGSGDILKTINTAPHEPVSIQLSGDETLLHVLLSNGDVATWAVVNG